MTLNTHEKGMNSYAVTGKREKYPIERSAFNTIGIGYNDLRAFCMLICHVSSARADRAGLLLEGGLCAFPQTRGLLAYPPPCPRATLPGRSNST